MKLLIITAAAFLAVFAPHARAQDTFSVIKVSAAMTAQYQDPLTNKLVKFPLTTKTLINIALNQDIRTAVPKNIVLGYAGIFDDFAHHTPNTSGPARLVVYNTDTGERLKTIGIASNRVVVENVVVNRFRRIATGALTIQDTSAGSPLGHFLDGSLQISGTVTRKPNGIATPENLRVTAVATAVGSLRLTFTRDGNTRTVTLVIARGALRGAGKIIGTFDET